MECWTCPIWNDCMLDLAEVYVFDRHLKKQYIECPCRYCLVIVVCQEFKSCPERAKYVYHYKTCSNFLAS